MTQSHCRRRRASEVNTAGKARLKRKGGKITAGNDTDRKKKSLPKSEGKGFKGGHAAKAAATSKQSLSKEPTFPLYAVTGNYIYIRLGSYMFMGSLSSHPSLSAPGCKSG